MWWGWVWSIIKESVVGCPINLKVIAMPTLCHRIYINLQATSYNAFLDWQTVVVDSFCLFTPFGNFVSTDTSICLKCLLLWQILAYLLISASSSATARTNYWVTNWGTDPFPNMISGSVAVSFLAFVAFALSSLISAYNLFNRPI